MPHLTPEHLISFVEVAELGNISRAAINLQLSQSALSIQLKHLQTALGEPLYRRKGHGITLTPLGEEFLPYARDLACSMARAEEFVIGRSGQESRTLGVGLCATLSERFPLLLLQRCRELCPSMSLDLHIAPTRELVKMVSEGQVSIALGGGISAFPTSGIEMSLVATEPLVWVASPQIAQDIPVQPEIQDLLRWPLLWAQPSSSVRMIAEKHIERLGLQLRGSQVLGSYSALREALQAGWGGAIVPRHLVPGLSLTGRLEVRMPKDVAMNLAYRLITAPTPLQSQAIRQLNQALTRTLQEIIGHGPVCDTG